MKRRDFILKASAVAGVAAAYAAPRANAQAPAGPETAAPKTTPPDRPPEPNLGPQKRASTVYASQAGARLDSSVLSGGGTDDTTAIQAILDQAPKLGNLHLIVDGAALVRGLDVYANTTIECPNPSCGFFLADQANRAILRNAHPSKAEIIDRNISVLGGTYNNNRAKQLHHREDKSPVTAIEFFGIEQLLLRDVVIRDQRTYCTFVSNWRHVQMEHIDIQLSDREHAENTDGLHFCGPGQFLCLRDIQGCTYDDFIALNADDGHSVYDDKGNLYNNGEQGPYVSFGPITDVLIDGVVLDGAAQGIRFLSRKSRIDRVVVRNMVGSYRSFGCFMDPFWEKGGNYGNIVFDTIDLRSMEPNYTYLPPFLFALGGSHERFTVRNLQNLQPHDNRKLIWVEKDAKIKSLSVDGLDIEADKKLDDPAYLLVEGEVDLLTLRNANLAHNGAEEPNGCLLAVGGKEPRGHIKHLQIQNITARHVKDIVRQQRGDIDRFDTVNVVAY